MNGEVNNQGCERIKINIREGGEATVAAISHLRSQGCLHSEEEESVISERGEDGEGGAGEGDIIQPYMAIGRRDR